jgi:putative ABC transport system substrate-binding protein
MRRRDVIALLGWTSTCWPLSVLAQQPSIPVVGFFRSTPSKPFAKLVSAFNEGLREAGFVEGRNVAVEYRWADNQLDRLPDLAADLVNRQVAAIIGNALAVRAARSVTETIPIVFVVADDPVESKFVASLSRPGGNLTGVTFFAGESLNVKRLEQLHDLIPQGFALAVLLDSNYSGASKELSVLQASAARMGRSVVVVRIESEREFEAAFLGMSQAGVGGVLVSGSPFFTSQRRTIIALAARQGIPASYDLRDYVEDGGLLSYGASISDAYHQAGIYVGQILRGAKPADMPVSRATKLELIINLRTAKTLGLAIPDTLLARADEVID